MSINVNVRYVVKRISLFLITSIELEIKQAALHVCVTDNGRGIPADRLEHSKSLGILGMRERSRELGGTVEIHSPEGKGTRVEATLPLASTAFQDTPDPQPTLVH